MHDAFSGYALTHPEFFQYTRYSFSVGNLGQLIINETATDDQKNVYVLSIPQDRQEKFWPTVLPEYKNFKFKNASGESLTRKITTAVASAVTVVATSFFSASSHSGAITDRGQHCKTAALSWGDIGLAASSVVCLAGIFALVVYGCYKAKKETSKQLEEEKPLV